MDVTVIGGRGFVGKAVSSRLQQDHDVTTVDPGAGGTGHISADITEREAVMEAVAGSDVVVNLVGLTPMREPRGTTYEAVHVDGAANVAAACEEHGARLVHMSALGADPDAATAYLRTKGEGREAVLEAGVDATVVEPSLIVDHGNELVAMAERFAWTRVFPALRTKVQPVYRGDIADLFRYAVEGEVEEDVLRLGGPDAMTLFGLVRKVYNANGYRCYPLPVQPLVSLSLYLTGPIPLVPYGADQARFLSFDNTVDRNDATAYLELTSVDEWLEGDRQG